MLRCALLLALAILLTPQLSQASPFALDLAKSKLQFTAIQNNAPITGLFPNIEGTFDFDPDHLEQSHVLVTVQLSEINTSYQDVATSLQAPDWFDTAQFPGAQFESTRFEKLANGQYIAHGNLTIRNQTHPITFPFTLLHYSKSSAEIQGSFEIARLNYGVGQGAWQDTSSVQDTVKLDIAFSFSGTD